MHSTLLLISMTEFYKADGTGVLLLLLQQDSL